MATRQQIRDMTWKQRISHFFFYYKWALLAVLFVLFFLVTYIAGIVTAEKYDLKAIMTYRGLIVQDMSDQITAEFEKYCGDYDGNGEVNMYVDGIALSEDPLHTDTGVETALVSRLMAETATGEVPIFIMNDDTFEWLFGKEDAEQFLYDFSEYTDAENVDGFRLYLRDYLVFKGSKYANIYPDDLFMCVRKFPGEPDGKKQERIAQNYEDALEFALRFAENSEKMDD